MHTGSCEVEGNVHKQKLNLNFLQQLLSVIIPSALHRRCGLGEVLIFLQYTQDCGCSMTQYDKEYFYWS